MNISGILIAHDKDYAIIRQGFTGYTYVCNARDVKQVLANGQPIEHDKKPEVVLQGYPDVACERITEYKKEGFKLAWKNFSNPNFHSEII